MLKKIILIACLSISSMFNITWGLDYSPIALGNPNSNVHLVYFFSPTCPHCAFTQPEMDKIIAEYVDTGRVYLTIYESANNLADISISQFSMSVGNGNRFKILKQILKDQEKIFSQISLIGNDINVFKNYLVKNYGSIFGVNSDKASVFFSDTNLINTTIKASAKIMSQYSLIGTPALIINNKVAPNPIVFEKIKPLIDKELNLTSKK